MRGNLLALVLGFLAADAAQAQQLKMAFNAGHVSIDATGVPVRTILSEWGKLGGTKVVGGERVSGAPLTVKLIDLPEAQALEIVLRSVAGYMAAPRTVSTGASMYDRILVLPVSPATTPRPAPIVTAPAPNPSDGTQRLVPPRPAVGQPAEELDDDEPEPDRQNPPVFTFPQPGQNGPVFPAVAFPQGGPAPPVPGNTGRTGAPTTTINPAPTGGFGIIGSPVPGMIQLPAPQPGQPARPGSAVRPPGA